MRASTKSAAAAATGVIAGLLTNMPRKTGPTRTRSSAVILVVAAVAYPVAGGNRALDDNALRHEVAAVLGTVALAVAAWSLPDRAARAVVAAGWVLHAVFDQTHTQSAGTRLPPWYPAMCAGFDLAMAAVLELHSQGSNQAGTIGNARTLRCI